MNMQRGNSQPAASHQALQVIRKLLLEDVVLYQGYPLRLRSSRLNLFLSLPDSQARNTLARTSGDKEVQSHFRAMLVQLA